MRSLLGSALRALGRDKLSTGLNVAGLAIAMACTLLLGLHLTDELTYDLHHVRHERIFRVANEYTTGGRPLPSALTSPALGPMLAEDFAAVQAYVRFRWTGTERLIRHGADAFYWSDVYAADAAVFDVFTHDILDGDPDTALDDPAAAAVSETFARRYFGRTDVLGETITLEAGDPRRITLVYADLPRNTHLKYDVLLSYASLADPRDPAARLDLLWTGNDYTYLLLPEGYDTSEFEAVSDTFFARYLAARAGAMNAQWRSWLEPLADIHLHSALGQDAPTGNRAHLLGFAAVAAFILLVASINYMNLATASAATRAKEIAMRKILGASRASLIARFLGESVLVSLAALVVAVSLAELALAVTPIAELLGKPLTLSFTHEPGLVAWLGGFALAIGVASGLYPAFYLSSAAPLAALHGNGTAAAGRARLREGLVLVQFTVSIAVVASTLLMASQMRFIAGRPLGFEPENRVVVPLRGLDTIERVPAIRAELERDERILGVSESLSIMGLPVVEGFIRTEDNDGTMGLQTLSYLPVGENFLDVMGIEIVAGRGFSADIPTDRTDALVVNEALVELMGWDEPLGKRVGERPRTVIGVAENFNFRSLHTPVGPIVMHPFVNAFAGVPAEARPFQQRYLLLQLSGEDVAGTLRFVEATLARFDAEHPFEYRFVDQALAGLYLSERRLTALIGAFSGVCIFVACLGLFGLASFTTARRTKEIGVRKVVGASTAAIIVLLSRRVLALVAIGAVLASILSYVVMDRWLAAFAYRVEPAPGAFALAAVLALAVAFATVALQSFGVARASPTHALRSE